jgi:AI-2 transport protein TqsA
VDEQTHAPYDRVIVILLSFLVAVVICLVLHQLGSIFKPLVLAFFLAIVATPVLEFFQRLHVPRWLAVLIIFLFVFVVLFGVGFLMWETGSTLVERAPSYGARLQVMVTDLMKTLRIPPGYQPEMLRTLDWGTLVQPAQAAGVAGSILGTFATITTRILLILVFFLFILVAWPGIPDRLRRAFPDERGDRLVGVFLAADDQVRRYLATKIAIGTSTGLVVFVILRSFGVDLAEFWAILVFVLGFIPNIGSVIATVPPIIISALQFGFGPRFFLVGILLIVSQNLIGNVIEPKLMGDRLNLSPLVIIISLIFWSVIWGAVGVILAVPITAVLRLAFDQVPMLKPVASLMGSGRIGGSKEA